MNSFIKASELENYGKKIFLKYFSTAADVREITDKDEQRECGDWEIDGIYHETKIENRYTGNLFLETYSNKSKNIPGWMFKEQKAVFLWYAFIDKETCYIFDFNNLKKWFKENHQNYREISQGKYIQHNNTYGRIVPIIDLKEAGLVEIEILDFKI